MIAATEKVEKGVEQKDFSVYFEAIFEFGAVSLLAANNPLIVDIIDDLLPSFQRIIFLSFNYRKDDIQDSVDFCRKMISCMETRDENRGDQVLRDYFLQEKEIAIEALKTLQAS